MSSEIEICQKHDNTVVIWLYPDEELCCPLCLAEKQIKEQEKRLNKLEQDTIPF